MPDSPDRPDQLLARIDRTVEATEDAATANELVDRPLCLVIADRLRDAVSDMHQYDILGRRAVHTAVYYFSLQEDAEDDLSSVIGFEDDARVANATFHAIGRPDLEIEIP